MRWILTFLLLLTLCGSAIGQYSVSNPPIVAPFLTVNDWLMVRGGHVGTLRVYGDAASNVVEFISDYDRVAADSSVTISPYGTVSAPRFTVTANNGMISWLTSNNIRLIGRDMGGSANDYLQVYVQGNYVTFKNTETGFYTLSPALNSVTLGDETYRVDLVISREFNPGSKADSSIHAWIYGGDGRVTTKSGGGDSLYMTSSTSYGIIGSNKPIQEVVGGNATRYLNIVTLADEGEFSMPTGICGFGDVMIGDNQEWAKIRFTSAGVVILQDASSNVTSTNDTDNNMNIYDGGTGIVIENQLGVSLKVCIDLTYYTP